MVCCKLLGLFRAEVDISSLSLSISNLKFSKLWLTALEDLIKVSAMDGKLLSNTSSVLGRRGDSNSPS
jgi:hypothetical protein